MNSHFEKLLILETDTVKNAMKQLDKNGEKNLYVINGANQLVGSLSDGDIRRAILKGLSIDENVAKIMNSNPKFIYEFDGDKDYIIKQTMVEHQIESIPILNRKNIITDIIFWIEIFKGEKIKKYSKKENKVFILAGGVGSRLEPFTKVLPKPLVPLGDQPIIEKIMDKFVFYGFGNFILSINYKADMIKSYFSDEMVRNKYPILDFLKEDEPLGTIGSLYLAKDAFKDSFFITNSDIIIEEDLEKIFSFHKANDTILTIVACIKNEIIPYGVLKTNDKGYLLNIEEKPAFQYLINTGVYVAEPEIIDFIKPKAKMDITEVIGLLLKEGKNVSIYPVFEEHWFDIGEWAELEKTRKYYDRL